MAYDPDRARNGVGSIAPASGGPPQRQRRPRPVGRRAPQPTGARYLTGGGDHVAVLGLLLLALVLAHRRRPVAAGVVIGLAAAIKLTARPLLPFLALAARDRNGRPAVGRFLTTAAAVSASMVAPFAVWDAPRLLDSVLLYPLGLAEQPTIARGPTLGRLLAAPFPGGKGVIAAVLAGIVFSLVILLATAGRPGYLIYPLTSCRGARSSGQTNSRRPAGR